MIIDAHAHLWKKQKGIVNGKPVFDIGGGKSDFGGEIRQMMPPFMTDGENSAERFLANMDYAGVSGAVITQEYIDGNQDNYLLACKSDRIKICALYEEKPLGDISDFDGIKICAGRLADKNLLNHIEPFRAANDNGKFISIYRVPRACASGHAILHVLDTQCHLAAAHLQTRCRAPQRCQF